jgi:uncharacterized membrane protein YphA (DoxX/SURF4 family)
VKLTDLNPLRCRADDLPANLIVLAKLIALWLLLTNQVRGIPGVFLPFLTFFDALPHPWILKHLLQTSLVVSGILVVFNVQFRRSVFVLGATLLVAIAASRNYYRNNILLCGLLLTFIAVEPRDKRSHFLRAQMTLVYAGAALNKTLDPDWQSGHFMQHWMYDILNHTTYQRLAGLLPTGKLSLIACWTTIITEWIIVFGLVSTAFFPRRANLVVWLGVLFHTSLLEVTSSTFRLFYNVACASYLALVVFEDRIDVTLDPTQWRHRGFHRLLQILDREQRVRVTEVVGHRFEAVMGARSYHGVWAARAAILGLPQTILLAGLLVTPTRATPLIALALVALASPIFAYLMKRTVRAIWPRNDDPTPVPAPSVRPVQ